MGKGANQNQFSLQARLPLVVLCIGLLISLSVYFYLQKSLRVQEEEQFTLTAKQISEQIVKAVNVMTYGLGGANGVFAASKSVEHGEFKDYVKSRNIQSEFPGAYGFGYIEYVKRENLDDFLRLTRNDEQPNFNLKSSGQLKDLFVIKYIEPEADNFAALGFDIGSDALRREAAEKAMLTGKPTLTRKIKLLQDIKDESGFLYLRPVYLKNLPLETSEQRRAAIEGWVYAPFTLEKVLSPVFAEHSDISIDIFDQAGLAEGKAILSRKTNDSIDPAVRRLEIEIGQQTWTIVAHPTTAFFGEGATRYVPLLAAMLGSFLSMVLAGLSWHYLSKKERLFATTLRREQLLSQGILDSANFSIIVTNPEGIIELFNQAASRMLGYLPSEVIGKTSPAIFHDESEIVHQAKILSKNLGKHIEPGFEAFVAGSRLNQADEKEWTYIRKDGSRFPVLLSITAMRAESGEIIAFMEIAHDISDKKEAESDLKNLASELEIRVKNRTEDLEESERRFRFLADTMPQIVWTTYPDGRVDYFNQRWIDYTGLTLEQSKDWGWSPVLHPDDLENCFTIWKNSLATGADYEVAYRFKRGKDQVFRWHLGRAFPLRDENQNITMWVGSCTDIDDFKRAQNDLIQLNEDLEKRVFDRTSELERATEYKSQFLANMSHEIRTPLTSIIGYSESLMLDELSLDEQQLAYQTIIKKRHSPSWSNQRYS